MTDRQGAQRIVHVIGSLNLGGGETQMVQLAIEQAARGRSVRVMALTEAGPLADALDHANVPYDVIGFMGYDVRHPIRTFAAIVRAFRAMRSARPDVVHTWMVQAAVMGLLLGRLLRVPARVSERVLVGESLMAPPRLRPLFRLAQRSAHAVVCNARAVADDVLEVEGIEPSRVHVIENAVTLPPITADLARQPAEGYMVANLRPQKNHFNLLAALAEMADPPVVHLIGSGPEEAAIRERIDELGLGGVVQLHGAVPGAADLFSKGQFGILSSDYEGMPNAMQECMARGVPMVATAVSGIPEMITDGVDGLLVPPQDHKALAAALARMASDPDLRSRLGAAARARMEPFAWDVIVQRHFDRYERVLSGGRVESNLAAR